MTTIYKQNKRTPQEKGMTDQYIITEEKLTTLKFCEDLLTRHEIAKEVRSNPYNPQTEQETILFSCIKSGNLIESREALEHLFNRHETCKSERIRCPLCREEIRGGKEV